MASVLPIDLKPLTKEQIEEARTWLRDLTSNGVTKAELARRIGVPRSTISQFLNDDEFVSEAAARGALNLKAEIEAQEKARAEAATTATPRPIQQGHMPDFILTRDAQRVLALCRLCVQDRQIGIVVGHAGAGKTTALRRFAQEHPGTIYITGDVLMTRKALVEELAEALGVEQYGNMRAILRKVSARLAANPRPVVIDEADLLVTDTMAKMEILRSLWDQAQCPMVLAGLPRLETFLTRGPSLRHNLAQLYSRIRYRVALQGLGADEAEELIAGFQMTDAVRRRLIEVATASEHGGLRHFVTLVQRSAAIAAGRGGTITQEILDAAAGMLLF